MLHFGMKIRHWKNWFIW